MGANIRSVRFFESFLLFSVFLQGDLPSDHEVRRQNRV
jgi:hypothetical protein